MKPIQMLDLQAEYDLFRERIEPVALDVLRSQRFIGGPAVQEFEQAMASRLGAGHAVALNTGTDALLCALMALDVGPGDEVILPGFTFIATAGVVARRGARPVFVDIDPRTFNMTPEGLEAALTDRTRAVMVVHLFGQCADMRKIDRIAESRGIPVVEDAAQAIGAAQDNRPACTLGAIGCLSFYPTKNLGGFGEGGMAITSDADLAANLRAIRNHGETQRYVCSRIGGNFRLDTLKAAILLIKLEKLDEFNERRRRNAALYDRLLATTEVATPLVAEGNRHVYHQYSILCPRRDELRDHLARHDIGSGVYYPVPLHLQACFAELGYREGDLPVCEQTCGRILSLPCHPMLTEDEVTEVARRIHEFYGTTMP